MENKNKGVPPINNKYGSQKNNKLKKLIRILIIIVPTLMFLGLATYVYYTVSNLNIGTTTYKIPAKIKGSVFIQFADSLRKADKNWKCIPPKEWLSKISKYHSPKSNRWFFIKKN